MREGGLEVHTTIEPRLQEVGLDAMRSALPYSEDPSSALVSIDPRNGQIEAMVSSSNYEESQFNLAAQGHRQPGSTFKTFVLTTAIKQGIDPYSTYYTSKHLDLDLPEWGHWEVSTADEGYLGTVNLQQATVASDNTVFAQLDLDVGPRQVKATAKSMGIESPLDGIPAEGIGGLRIGVSPLEMADAYATLAAGGIHRNPIAIERVVFPGGRVDEPRAARAAAGRARSRSPTRSGACCTTTSPKAPAPPPTPAAPARAARPARPTTSPTPGSPASSPTWRPSSGSATRSRTRSK